MATILIKKRDTTGAPGAGDLTNSTGGAEIAVNTFDKRLFSKNSGGTIVELGTNPSSITLGSDTISSFGTGVSTALGVNTGTAGAFVVNGGALGTPSSGTLTNATGLPIATGVSGLGTNVASFLATPSSSNLAAALTDETGTGVAVFGTGPTIGTATLNRSLLNTTKEKITVSATAATGTVDFDAITQSVLYYTTDASGNWTLNVRGDSGTTLNSIMSTGESITVVFLATQGSTAYYQTAVQVDGSSVTPKWQNDAAPTGGNASSVDSYTLTIVKTADATFTVFGSQTQFA